MPSKTDEVLKEIKTILTTVISLDSCGLGPVLTTLKEEICGLREDIKSLTTAIKDANQISSNDKENVLNIEEFRKDIKNLTEAIQDSRLQQHIPPTTNMTMNYDDHENEDENEDEDVSEQHIHEMALRVRNGSIHIWSAKTNQRKQHLYQQMRNKCTSQTYSEWLQGDTYVPKKFQPKRITGEPEVQWNLRYDLAKSKMRTEAELTSLRAKSHWDKVQSIDKEMYQLIEENAGGQIKEHLKEMYRQECEKMEVIARCSET